MNNKVYHHALLVTVHGKDGRASTTQYRLSLRYTHDYLIVNTLHLQGVLYALQVKFNLNI